MDQQQLMEYDKLVIVYLCMQLKILCISFDDASHRNVSFLTLEVFIMLVVAGRVSEECWDFILCSAVTVMQVCGNITEFWNCQSNFIIV